MPLLRDAKEVTFLSSGAISRAHYALVRKVEAADSPPLADQHILAEVQSIRRKLADSSLTTKRCKTCLMELLYCSMATSASVSKGLFDFAFPYAVKLAEAGRSLTEKRVGYVFCAELMPPGHEMYLMLVNTIRKDLESSSIPRICFALESLISSTTEDIIPAIQSRLHDLLSHSSAHVRRRALLAFRALSKHSPNLLGTVTHDVKKRLRDRHPEVSISALMLLTAAIKASDHARNEMEPLAKELLISTLPQPLKSSMRSLLLKLLQTVRDIGASEPNPDVFLEIINDASSHQDRALLLGGFKALSQMPVDSLISSAHALVQSIRPWLTSRDPNDQYLFLSCLMCLHPSLWAGTDSTVQPAFEGWEVERVMLLLNSPDRLIRMKTLQTLQHVEPELVAVYYKQSVQAVPASLPEKDKNELVSRLLEILESVTGEDGESYAQQVKSLLPTVEGESTGSVLDRAVDIVLRRIREAGDIFRISCVASLLASAIEPSVSLGPTSLVLVSALACEFSDQLPTSPADLVSGLASRLQTCPANIQDVLLLSTMRIIAQCEVVPSTAVDAVMTLRQQSSRHIRRRCAQFLKLYEQKDVLRSIVTKASSSSLPDFLASLENFESSDPALKSSNDLSQTSSPSVVSASIPSHSPTPKLRYAAYDAPQPITRRRRSAGPSSQRSISGSSLSNYGNRSSTMRSDSSDGRTDAAGALAIAAAEDPLDIWSENTKPEKSDDPKLIDDLTSRVDLIAFDSPFVAEPWQEQRPDESVPESASEFERAWSALQTSDTRGWSAASVDGIIGRLQDQGLHLIITSSDKLPFEGETKVSVSLEASQEPSAHLRLRGDEDASCLWRMRSADDSLRATIKALLSDA